MPTVKAAHDPEENAKTIKTLEETIQGLEAMYEQMEERYLKGKVWGGALSGRASSRASARASARMDAAEVMEELSIKASTKVPPPLSPPRPRSQHTACAVRGARPSYLSRSGLSLPPPPRLRRATPSSPAAWRRLPRSARPACRDCARPPSERIRHCAVRHAGETRADAVFVFRQIVVFVAFLESFAHGANDTANSTSAFSAIYSAYTYSITECHLQETPWWIMSIAGGFVALGVMTLGYRVIQTLGTDIADIDYHMAFCVESASTCSVVIATFLGLPVSSTHCQVGAIVFVGMAKAGCSGSDCGLFAKIAVRTWVATIPIAVGISAGCMAALSAIFRHEKCRPPP